jgi:TonB family protein
MALPLQSEERVEPVSVQFAHFGVLDTGSQSKSSVFVSMVTNLTLLLIFFIISAAAKKTMDKRNLLTQLTEPVVKKKVEPVKPKVVPPAPKPPPPVDLPKVEVHLPRVIVPPKPPDVPKPPEVKMDVPKPVIAAPAPAKVTPMLAPVKVDLSKLQAANNVARASSVTLGNQNNPTLHGPSVANVNLSHGVSGPVSNGPVSTQISLGGSVAGSGRGTGTVHSVGLGGSPTGSPRGTGSVQSVGLPHGGVPGGTGTETARAASQVNLAQAAPPPAPKPAPVASLVQPKPAKVVAKPKPEYTAEARQLHIEGVVTLRIRVQPDGEVQVLGVVNGLGHGLDESAKRAIMATRFEPATDGYGHAVAWDGIVNVTFQLAG